MSAKKIIEGHWEHSVFFFCKGRPALHRAALHNTVAALCSAANLRANTAASQSFPFQTRDSGET